MPEIRSLMAGAMLCALSAGTLAAQDVAKSGTNAARTKKTTSTATKNAAGTSAAPSAAATPSAAARADSSARVAAARTTSDVAAAPAPAPASAPVPAPRHIGAAERGRTWYTLGVGPAYGGLSCSGCQSSGAFAVSANAAVGVALRERLMVGVQAHTWLDIYDAMFDQTVLGLQAVARWYPTAARPLSLTGAIGVLGYRRTDGFTDVHETVPSAQATVAWDIRTRSGATVSPYLSILTTTKGSLKSSAGVVPGLKTSFGLAQFGVSVGWF